MIEEEVNEDGLTKEEWELIHTPFTVLLQHNLVMKAVFARDKQLKAIEARNVIWREKNEKPLYEKEQEE